MFISHLHVIWSDSILVQKLLMMVNLWHPAVIANLLHCKAALSDSIPEKLPVNWEIWGLYHSVQSVSSLKVSLAFLPSFISSSTAASVGISWRNFKKRVISDLTRIREVPVLWWQPCPIKLHIHISLKIVNCLLIWHVHLFAHRFKSKLYSTVFPKISTPFKIYLLK